MEIDIFVGYPPDMAMYIGCTDDDLQGFDLDENKEYIVRLSRIEGEETTIDIEERGNYNNLELDGDGDLPQNNTYSLPSLYGVDKKQKERIWKIWVDGPTVYKSYGEVGGKATPSFRT